MPTPPDDGITLPDETSAVGAEAVARIGSVRRTRPVDPNQENPSSSANSIRRGRFSSGV
jgi:hypothetical protein